MGKRRPSKKKVVKRRAALPPPFRLTRAGVREINNLLEFTPPDDLRNTLIEIYHTYITQHHHAFPVNFPHMSSQMNILLDTLKNLQSSTKTRGNKNTGV